MKKRIMFFLAALPLLFSCLSNSGTTADADYLLYEDIVFSSGEGWELELDLAVPKKGRDHPLIIYYYGYGFAAYDRKINHFLIDSAVSHGYALAFAEYRSSAQAAYPAPVSDAKEAVRFLRFHSGEYHLDPDRIASWGFSSGAYLALMVGATGNDPEFDGGTSYPGTGSSVSAVVNHCGPVDFRLQPSMPHRIKYLGIAFEKDPGRWEAAGVTPYLDRDTPPVLSFYGEMDSSVPFEHGRELDKKIRMSNGTHLLMYNTAAGHGQYDNNLIWWFLDAHLK